LVNDPLTFEITMCLNLNVTSECVGSITHFIFAIENIFNV